MPATPAWPPASSPRLFIEQELGADMTVRLDGNGANYLANVMRQKVGDTVILFDDMTGSWAAEITHVERRSVELTTRERLKVREQCPDFWLCASPIKRARFDFMVEKACEMGVRRFVPVLTDRGVVDKIKPDRLRAHMIEAAEQCERNALPELSALTPLEALLRDWPEDRTLFFCDERLYESGEGSFRRAMVANEGPAAILVGPEGGFTDAENQMIRDCPQSVPVSLGPRILRAETAALAATALWMAGRGDWNPPSP